MTTALTPAHVAQLQLNLPTSAYGAPALVNPGQEPGQPGAPDLLLPTRGSLTLMAALRELQEAQPSYALAEQFYDGQIGELFATDKVAQLLARAGVNSIEDLNYAAVPVDAIVEKLIIRAVTCAAGNDTEPAGGGPRTISDGPDEPQIDERKSRTEQAQEVLDELRSRNQLDDEEDELHLNVSKHGDCYLFVWPVYELDDRPDEDDPELDDDDEAQPAQGRPVAVDMFVNGANCTRAFYDAENPLRMSHVVKQWDWIDPGTDEQRVRATLYFPDRIERWVTKPRGDSEAGNVEDPKAWQPFAPDGVWPLPNPTGRLPFFHFRNGRPHGKPEHQPAYGAQRLVNKLISAHAVTIDYQSFPQRYALTNPKADEVLSNLIDPDFPEDADDDPEGDGHSQLRADPSAVWKLPGISSVGQFSPADPQVFLSPLDRYIRSISELCGIPVHRFSGFTQPPSGEALRVANEPLNDKSSRRQKSYGAVWADAYEYALEMLGYDDITVSVQWKPVEQAIGSDDWGIVAAKIANGVPVKQALMEAGYPLDEVEKWLSDETGANLIQRVALLNSIGTAVQTLGAGVGLGVVSPEQVGNIISRVLGAAGEDLPLLEEPVQLHPAMAQQQMDLQNTMRNRQLADHIAGQPGADERGNPRPAPNLPPMPQPPPPVEVGADG